MAEGRTAFERSPGEWYVEPTSATDFLLEREEFLGDIWDPACGGGNVVKAALARGYDAYGTDLHCRVRSRSGLPPWWMGSQDFLTSTLTDSNIVCNAPYGGAKLCEAFIRHAFALGSKSARCGKVAFFASSKFLFAECRATGLYAELPPDRVRPVFPRPSCPPGDVIRRGRKAGNGIENYVWLVWDLAEPTGRTEFIWE